MKVLTGSSLFRCHFFSATLILAFVVATPVTAQFDTVINAPPTVIGDNESIGSDTQLNVFDSGIVGDNFDAGSNDPLTRNV